MASFPRYLKPFQFGTMLYGVIPFCILLVLLFPPGLSQSNSIIRSLGYGNSAALFITSVLLGAYIDNCYRSNPQSSILKPLFLGSFICSFLFVASIMLIAYLAFTSYDIKHHTHTLPQNIFATWPSALGHLLEGTIIGGFISLPFNYLFIFLVRRHYGKPASP